MLNVYVNSGVGSVIDAMAMHDYLVDLENKGVKVNRIGRGIIASAATYLLLGKNSSMSENSWFMIHNTSGAIWGDVNEIENYAKTMRKFNNAVRDLYVNCTGLPPETVSSMMNKETWLTGKEAKDKGFVCEVGPTTNFTNKISNESWPFMNMTVLNSYNSFTKKPSEDMDYKKITEAINKGFDNLLNSLGIDPKKNKDTETAVNNFKTSLNEAFKDADNDLDEKVQNKVVEVLKGDSFKNAVKEVVNDATKDIVNKADLDKITNGMEKLKTDIIDKIGNPANVDPKAKPTNSKFEHEGISFKS